jgi:hypothetical protein
MARAMSSSVVVSPSDARMPDAASPAPSIASRTGEGSTVPARGAARDAHAFEVERGHQLRALPARPHEERDVRCPPRRVARDARATVIGEYREERSFKDVTPLGDACITHASLSRGSRCDAEPSSEGWIDGARSQTLLLRAAQQHRNDA